MNSKGIGTEKSVRVFGMATTNNDILIPEGVPPLISPCNFPWNDRIYTSYFPFIGFIYEVNFGNEIKLGLNVKAFTLKQTQGTRSVCYLSVVDVIPGLSGIVQCGDILLSVNEKPLIRVGGVTLLEVILCVTQQYLTGILYRAYSSDMFISFSTFFLL